MSAHILNGFKCFLDHESRGRFGVLVVDPFHPWFGATDADLPFRTFETGLRESVTFKHGGANDWLIIFVSQEGVSDLQRISQLAHTAEQLRRPPDFMIEEFKDAYLDEMKIMGLSAPADRLDTWRSYVSVCIDNKIISKRRARHMLPPRELFKWEI